MELKRVIMLVLVFRAVTADIIRTSYDSIKFNLITFIGSYFDDAPLK